MRLKSPGGNLVWITPLLVIGGAYMAVEHSRNGSPGFAVVYGSMAFLAAMVWFDLRWVAWPLLLYFAVALFGGIYLMSTPGFSWRSAIRIVCIAYMIYDFWH